jgi:hypothetical protein
MPDKLYVTIIDESGVCPCIDNLTYELTYITFLNLYQMVPIIPNCLSGCSQTSGGPWDYGCDLPNWSGASIGSQIACFTLNNVKYFEFNLDVYFGCYQDWNAQPKVCNYNFLQPRVFTYPQNCNNPFYAQWTGVTNFYNNRSAGASYMNPFGCSGAGTISITITE